MVLITNLHQIKHLIQGCILLDYMVMTIVKLFMLNDSTVFLVDACEENDLSRNS